MSQILKSGAVFVVSALLLVGCCSTRPTDHVAIPSQITVSQALADVGTGLAALKMAELQALTNSVFKGMTNFVTGLFPAEVDVTFNVTASDSDSKSLVIDVNAGPFPQVPVGGKIGGSLASQESAARGNQITLRFTSALFARTTTVTSTNGSKTVVEEGIVDATKLKNFLNVVQDGQINESLRIRDMHHPDAAGQQREP